MKWIIDGDEYESAAEAAEVIIDGADFEEAYEEMLTDVYGDVTICGYNYDAGYALKEIDPTAYRCGMNDFADGERSNIIDELEGMDDGDEADIYGYTVTCVDPDEDEDESDE